MILSNTLYIALFIRSDPPIPNDFHWALYHASSPTTGTKYHIVNLQNGWIAGHEPLSTSSILKSFLLVGLVRVANINTSTSAVGVTNSDVDADVDVNKKIDTLLRSQDDKLNDKEGVTCRTWLFEMLAVLYDEGLLVDVRDGCDGDMHRLEQVTKAWGNEFAEGAARNVQPRPVGN